MKKIFFSLTICILLLGISSYAFAASDEIKELEETIGKLQLEEQTLANQLELLDAKIEFTSKKISQLDQDRVVLENNLSVIDQKVRQTEPARRELFSAVAKQTRDDFKDEFMVKGRQDLLLLLAADTDNETIKRKELAIALDQRLMLIYGEILVRFDNLAARQKETLGLVEEAAEQIKAEQQELVQVKKDRQRLVAATNNDETKYQELLSQAKAEQKAIKSFGREKYLAGKKGVAVKQGDIIAQIGNSGHPSCSTSKHLHFEVTKDGGLIDPALILAANNNAVFETDVKEPEFGGDLIWPIKLPRITQEYGMSLWARLGWYNGGPHTGIDMISRSSDEITAPVDGILYQGSTTCGESVMNFVALDHQDGLVSWYWHIK